MMKTLRQTTNAASAIALVLLASSCLAKAQELGLGSFPREELAREPTISPPTNSPPTTILISTQPEEYALKKLTVTPTNATSVEVVFVLPSFAVNRRGKAELNYTGLPLPDDYSLRPELPPESAVWLRRQNIKTAGGIFPRSTIKYYLGNLKPNFRYWFKLSVHFQDQEPPFDEPLEGNMEYVDMPSTYTQNLVPFTTTTTTPATTEPTLSTQPSTTTTASTTTTTTTTNTPESTSPTTTTRASTTSAQSITIKPVTATTVANTASPTTARTSTQATTIDTTPQVEPKTNSPPSPIMSTLLTILNATQPISVASPVPSPAATVTSTTTSSTSTSTTTTTTTTTTSTTTTPSPASSTEPSGRSVSLPTSEVETPERDPPTNLASLPTISTSASSTEAISTLSVLASTITGAATSKPPVSLPDSLTNSEQNSTRTPPVTSSWREQLYKQLNAPLQPYALYLSVAFVVMTILFIFVSYKYIKKSSRARMAQITSQPAYDNPSFTKLVSYYANQNYHNDALLAKQKNLEVDKTSPFHAQHNQLNDIHHHHHLNQNGKQHLI